MKGVDVNVNKDRKGIKEDNLEFNTYCIFAGEKQNIDEAIGTMFRDYIEKLKRNKK